MVEPANEASDGSLQLTGVCCRRVIGGSCNEESMAITEAAGYLAVVLDNKSLESEIVELDNTRNTI